MRIIYDLDEMTKVARGWLMGGSVGFVPTMGNLHNGHLTLIRTAHNECEISVVSIFVNPLQFPSLDEAQRYPHTIQRDLQLLQTVGIDVAFLPSQQAMYATSFATFVTPIGPVAERLEGADNTNFARGVATVVTKLLQIVRPDKAYFGQKDAQQVAIVRQVVRDLGIDVTLRILQTVREDDGLAMSSRNSLLSLPGRSAAPLLYQALLSAKSAIDAGEHRAAVIKQGMRDALTNHPLIMLEYIAICQPTTFLEVEQIRPGTLLVVAARIDNVRLSDNILWQDNGAWLL